MAATTALSVLATAQTAALANSANLNSEGSLLTGNLQIATATWVTTAGYVNTDTVSVSLVRIPSGCRVIPDLCRANVSAVIDADGTIETAAGDTIGTVDFNAASTYYIGATDTGTDPRALHRLG